MPPAISQCDLGHADVSSGIRCISAEGARSPDTAGDRSILADFPTIGSFAVTEGLLGERDDIQWILVLGVWRKPLCQCDLLVDPKKDD